MAAQVGADARRIIFEVTESAAMFDPGTTMDVLTRMRVKNFGLSIDDFGTGYSSLKQLYLMPFSELKIDTSFVRDIFAHEDARTMVETMVLLAHKLRLTACAEGVESQEVLDFLDWRRNATARRAISSAAPCPATRWNSPSASGTQAD